MPAKVLIADDSLFMRTLLKRVLAPLDVEVVAEAENGDEAIEGYQQHRPDLLLLDITMPGTNGLTAARRILEADPKACIVVCSAIAQTAKAQEALSIGVLDLITKPFDVPELQERLRRILSEQKR